jgi:hypothetical protein
MKTVFRLISLLMIFTMFIAFTQAQNRKAGLNSASFLNVGVGARNVGLGSAASSITNDVNQVFWNPAGAALRTQTLQAAVNYNKWIGDLDHNCVAVGYNLQDVGTISLGVITFGCSDIPANRDRYTNPELDVLSNDPNSGSTYSYMDMVISGTYSRYLLDNLALGITAKYINETIDDVNAGTFAMDFGTIYSISKAWKISARMSNLGGDIKFYDVASPIPLTFSIGTSYEFSSFSNDGKMEDVKTLLSIEAVKPNDGPQYFYGGAELSLIDNMVAIRGGYKFFYSNTMDEGTAWRSKYVTTLEHYSIGGSLKIPITEYDIFLDYSYTAMDLYDGGHRFSIRFGM